MFSDQSNNGQFLLGRAMARLQIHLILLVLYVGCDAVSRTELTVNNLPSDTRDPSEITEIVTSAVDIAAAKFGLRELERTDVLIAYTDSTGGNNPRIFLGVGEPHKLPVTIEISEYYIDYPTQKHRALAGAIVSTLRTHQLDAVVISQTPAFWEGDGFVLVAISVGICAIPLLLISRRWKARRKAKVKSNGK